MSLRLLIDEDCQAKALIALLRSAGHDVATVKEEGLEACDDRAVLVRSYEAGRVLVTRNADHFRELHDSGVCHHGVLAIYQSSDPTKNMSYTDIARSLSNLEAAGFDLTGEFVVLNAWTY